MNIRTSYIMDYHLNELGYDFKTTSIDLPKIIEKDIDTIIDSLKILYPSGKITEKINKEAKINGVYVDDHINIVDYFTYSERLDIKIIEYLGLGLEFLKRLSNKLSKCFPNERFSLIMEFSSVQEDIEYPGLEACYAYFEQIEYQEDNYFEKTNEWNLDKDYSIGMLEIRVDDDD